MYSRDNCNPIFPLHRYHFFEVQADEHLIPESHFGDLFPEVTLGTKNHSSQDSTEGLPWRSSG